MDTLSENTKFIRISNAVAAATTAITSDAVDMQGYDACCFTVAYGAIASTATNTVKVQQSSDNDTDAYSDLDGSTVTVADDDDNQLVVVDVIRPTKRYLKVVATRGVATAVVDGIFAQQYKAKTGPVTQPTTVVDVQTLLSPAEA